MPKNIISIAHHFEPVDLEALRARGYLLQDVPFSQRSYEVCKIAAESDGICLREIPKSLLNDELVHLCVNSYGTALLEAPDEYWTDKQLCLKAFCFEHTFNVFYNSHDKSNNPNYYDLIYQNAVLMCPQLKSIMELRVDPVIAAGLIKIYSASTMEIEGIDYPTLE